MTDLIQFAALLSALIAQHLALRPLLRRRIIAAFRNDAVRGQAWARCKVRVFWRGVTLRPYRARRRQAVGCRRPAAGRPALSRRRIFNRHRHAAGLRPAARCGQAQS